MFCQHCGNQIDDDAKFCPKCGAKINEAPAPQGEKDEFFRDVPPSPPAYQQPYYAQQQPSNKTNTLAVIGFVFSFLISIVGLICSIIGLQQCNQTKEGGKGLAIAGIVISSVSMGIAVIVSIVVLCYYPFLFLL
ncbi:MAG: zinc-ribbon domain-containing protein [Clostridia bacterium]|nr:zinc-ribbon domain-containing protein [Clostridia bacterium]